MTLLIFDCDGVLVDSEIIALTMLAVGLNDLGLPHTFEDGRRLFMGKSVKDVLIEIETMLGRPLPPEWGRAMNAALLDRLKEELKPVAGVADALAALACPRCVASSSQPSNAFVCRSRPQVLRPSSATASSARRKSRTASRARPFSLRGERMRRAARTNDRHRRVRPRASSPRAAPV